MKKITIILIFITSIGFGQTYSLDNTFNPSDTGVYSQYVGEYGVVLNSGKILTTGGLEVRNTDIYRLNSDGSLDNSFTKLNIPYSIDRFFANRILGNFITVKGSIDSEDTTLKSYDANGVEISSFTSPKFTKTDNLGGAISKIFFLNDGKFLIFGQFNFVNGISYNNIVRLNANGSIDTGFSIGTGFSGTTTAFAIQSDGKYIVGGDFSSFNGVTKGKIARLNSNGLLDTSFDVITQYNIYGIYNGYGSSPINDIIIQPDGKILTAGPGLWSGGSKFRRDIVRLNPNGTTDITFNYVMNSTGNYVRNLLYNADGSIFFKKDSKIEKCDNSGNAIYSFKDTNIMGGIYRSEGTMIQQNNKLIVLGNYKNSLGITRLGYHRLNSDGTLDLTFNPHFGPNNVFAEVTGALSSKIYHSILPDNKILLFGGFSTYNDIPVKSAIRLSENGEIDPSFNISSTINPQLIRSISTKKNYDGKLYIYGDFKGDFQSPKQIIKLNYDGSVDPNFNFNFRNSIYNLTITNENKIIAIGTIADEFKIIKFNSDGSIDNTFTSPTFDYIPSSIEVLDDNKILVSLGDHTFHNNDNRLLRLNENGSLDNTFSLLYYWYNYAGIYRTKTINGKTYVYGVGSSSPPYNGSGFLMRYNADWTMDNTFVPIATSTYTFLSNERTVTDSPTVNNYKMYRINDSNGNQLSTFSSGVLDNYDGIEDIGSQNCENLILSGTFYKVNNLNKHNICRLTVPGSVITPAPTGEMNQLFAQGQTLADLIVYGQNIQWYDYQNQCAFNALNKNSNQLNSLLPSNTLLTNGTTYYVSQTINGFESNYRLPVTVTVSLGLNELTLSNLRLFPNPVKDRLTISNSSSIEKIELYNLIGQKIFENYFLTDKTNIDLTNYKKGVYLLKIFSEGKVQTNKLIKE
jgi:uncharacterized delta-60 repeat protein